PRRGDHAGSPPLGRGTPPRTDGPAGGECPSTLARKRVRHCKHSSPAASRLETFGEALYQRAPSGPCRMITDPLFYLAAIPAVVIVGLAKGGFVGLGILGLPLMALTVSPVQAAAIMLPILIVQDAVGLYAFRKHLNKRLLAIT